MQYLGMMLYIVGLSFMMGMPEIGTPLFLIGMYLWLLTDDEDNKDE